MGHYIQSTDTRGLTALAEKRYWSPQTQDYAAGDHLLWYLYAGWSLSHKVEAETHWFSNNRYVIVYKFTLAKGSSTFVMSVVNNPFVQNLARELQTDIAQIWEQAQIVSDGAKLPRR